MLSVGSLRPLEWWLSRLLEGYGFAHCSSTLPEQVHKQGEKRLLERLQMVPEFSESDAENGIYWKHFTPRKVTARGRPSLKYLHSS
ncbi:hypothetical protein E2C01_022188 [Portunus trituberculatus]|uniref:Uncharacterized protein n=1 Tax=Portunus trituberculatus TaxID=210409 RepID=A0A5B7E4Q0_PORTR|nr:hypothetical protein [Portunus trituberculatus]